MRKMVVWKNNEKYITVWTINSSEPKLEGKSELSPGFLIVRYW
jgi:hypothetical protein